MCPGLADKYPEFKCTLSKEDIRLYEPLPHPAFDPAQAGVASGLSPAFSSAFSFVPPSGAERGGRGAGEAGHGGRGEELQVPSGESVCTDVGRCGHCRLNYLWRWARAARVGLVARDVMFPRLHKVSPLTKPSALNSQPETLTRTPKPGTLNSKRCQGDWGLPDLDGCLRRPHVSTRCVMRRIVGYARPFLLGLHAFNRISNAPFAVPPSPPLHPVDVRHAVAASPSTSGPGDRSHTSPATNNSTTALHDLALPTAAVSAASQRTHSSGSASPQHAARAGRSVSSDVATPTATCFGTGERRVGSGQGQEEPAGGQVRRLLFGLPLLVGHLSISEQIEGHILQLLTRVLRARCPKPLAGNVLVSSEQLQEPLVSS